MKKAADFFEKYNLFFMIPVIAAYGFTRLFYLGEISYYIHMDELLSAYEAFCVAHFGTGSIGGMGEGHSALLILLGAILMKLKSGYFSLKLFRLISVAAGGFGLVFSYLFAWEWTGKKKGGFIAASLVTALPIYFISQRHSLEDYLLLAILPAAFYFLLAGIKRSKPWMFLLSGLFFAAGLFSCRMAVIMIPVFLILSILYLVPAKKTGLLSCLALCVPVIAGVLLLFAFSGVSIIKTDPHSFLSNIRRFRAMFWDDRHDFNVIGDFGTLYVFSIPILVTGIIVSFKKVITSVKGREFDADVLLWLFLLSGYVCALFVPKADIRTAAPLFFAVSMLLVAGIMYIGENLKGTFPVIMLILFFSLGLLSHYYFVNYNSQLNHSKDHEKGIIIDKSVGEAVKAALRLYPGRGVTVCTGDDFEGRNLLIALYGGASPADYASFQDSSSFSFNDIEVNPVIEDISYDRIYVIDQAGRPELIDMFTSAGWGVTALKEYTLFYMN